MKKIKMFLIAAVALFAAHISFAGAQDFVLVNATEHNILSVYASPSSRLLWEEDLLRGYLNSGDWTKFTFTGFNDDLWDIRIVYRDSKPDAIFTKLQLKKIVKIVLRDSVLGGTTATAHYL